MKKFMTVALVALMTCVSAWAQVQPVIGSLFAAGTACSTEGACVQIEVPPSNGGITVTIYGTFVETMQFEGSLGANAYFAVSGSTAAGTGSATSATAAGTWFFVAAGFTNFRVRTSAYTSGSATVIISPSNASPGGGGTVSITGTVSENLAQVNAATVNVGVGAAGTGTQRVTTSTDSTVGITGALPTGSNIIGRVGVDQTTPGVSNLVAIETTAGAPITAVTDPCDGVIPSRVAVSQTADTTLITAASAKTNYICGFLFIVNNSAGATEVVNVIEGTGAGCVTTQTAAIMGSTTEANGMTITSNGIAGNRLVPGSGTNVNTCLMQVGTARISGYMLYVQQ